MTFLSTLSLRRATGRAPSPPRREFYFYPRSPCGERRHLTKHPQHKLIFLSTLSLRRATTSVVSSAGTTGISIHALLAESDFVLLMVPNLPLRFLSTLSLRRATDRGHIHTHFIVFLSTLSLRRATSASASEILMFIYFYPRSPCGERRARASWGQTSQ